MTNDIRVGDSVFVKPDEAESYVAAIRNKIKDGRVGEVKRHREWTNDFIVEFPAAGRKQMFRHHFRASYLQKVDPVRPSI